MGHQPFLKNKGRLISHTRLNALACSSKKPHYHRRQVDELAARTERSVGLAARRARCQHTASLMTDLAPADIMMEANRVASATTLYEVLGVSHSATEIDIRRKYREVSPLPLRRTI